MSVREVTRVFTGMYAARRGISGVRLCLQCRAMSTETQEAVMAAPGSVGGVVERRAASSWSGDRSVTRSVTGERGSPGFLQRALPDKSSNGTDKTKEDSKSITKYYIDTHAMVRTLEEGGYSCQQAESMVNLLSSTFTANLDPLITAQVTRKDIELLVVQVAAEIEALRSNLILLEKSTIDTLRNENEVLANQIKKLHEILKEEVKKVQSGVQLDLNLEKGRLKEDSTNLSQKIKDTNNRIETEVAQLKTQIESQKLESIKYLAGGIFSVVTIVLSVMLGLSRLLK